MFNMFGMLVPYCLVIALAFVLWVPPLRFIFNSDIETAVTPRLTKPDNAASA